MQPNTLYFGDNLQVLRGFPDACVDLVYLDPPFNSKRDYNMIYRDVAGTGDTAQAQAFTDTWTMEGASAEFQEVTTSGRPEGELIDCLHRIHGGGSLVAYLSVMALRLRELHRVLKPTGSLYLHCDPTASHYLKLVLDCIFGASSFRADITWQRHNARSTADNWPHVHDVVLCFARGRRPFFRVERRAADPRKLPHTLITGADGLKYQTFELTAPGRTAEGDSGQPWRGFDPTPYGRHWANCAAQREEWHAAGLIHWPGSGTAGGFPRRRAEEPFDPASRQVVVGDVWTDIDRINQSARERLGYPTQKPLALLERIISASSNPGDLVLDPFCGCGTAVAAAQQLGRRWVGIDITSLAVTLIRERLADHFPEVYPTPGDVPVIGLPADVAGARLLFETDPYDFQFWALTLVGAHPPGGQQKRGADRGIDGFILWRDGQGTLQRAVVSVKGGGVNVSQVRDLKAVVEREHAAAGVFVTLHPPSRPMREEAALGGEYVYAGGTGRYPRIQIVTVEELLAGHRPDLPRSARVEAHREARPLHDDGGQGELELE